MQNPIDRQRLLPADTNQLRPVFFFHLRIALHLWLHGCIGKMLLLFQPGQIRILSNLAEPCFKLTVTFESVYIFQRFVKCLLRQILSSLRITAQRQQVIIHITVVSLVHLLKTQASHLLFPIRLPKTHFVTEKLIMSSPPPRHMCGQKKRTATSTARFSSNSPVLKIFFKCLLIPDLSTPKSSDIAF